MKFSLLHSDGFNVIGMECKARLWDCDGAVGRLWSDFLTRANEIKQASSLHFKYMAAIGVNNAAEAPLSMTKRFIRAQNFFRQAFPDFIGTPDAYSGTIGYANRSLGYDIEDYDNIEVYEDIFQDPDVHSFKLLIPIK